MGTSFVVYSEDNFVCSDSRCEVLNTLIESFSLIGSLFPLIKKKNYQLASMGQALVGVKDKVINRM